jgi:hypothetical protein
MRNLIGARRAQQHILADGTSVLSCLPPTKQKRAILASLKSLLAVGRLPSVKPCALA